MHGVFIPKTAPFLCRWFLTTIFSGLLGAVLLLLYNVALFIIFFVDRESLRYNCNYPSNLSACDATLRIFGVAIPDPVFPTLTAIFGVLAFIAVLLLGHLSAFHVFLCKHLWLILVGMVYECLLLSSLPLPFPFPVSKGLTTYDYIMREREKDKEDSAAGVKRGFHGRCACVRRKVSRILNN